MYESERKREIYVYLYKCMYTYSDDNQCYMRSTPYSICKFVLYFQNYSLASLKQSIQEKINK